jgi:hypothetical protein
MPVMSSTGQGSESKPRSRESRPDALVGQFGAHDRSPQAATLATRGRRQEDR